MKHYIEDKPTERVLVVRTNDPEADAEVIAQLMEDLNCCRANVYKE